MLLDDFTISADTTRQQLTDRIARYFNRTGANPSSPVVVMGVDAAFHLPTLAFVINGQTIAATVSQALDPWLIEIREG